MKRILPFALVGLMVVSLILGAYRNEVKTFVRELSMALTLQPTDSISIKTLQTLLKDKKITLVNVHTPYESEIPQTDAFIPYDQIVANAANLPKDKNAPIILYCKSGRMSQAALITVRKLGYTNVKHLAGGMDAWQKSGGKLLDLAKLEASVLPKEGITLPVSWADLGKKLVDTGVINLAAFRKAVKMTPEQEKILTDGSEDNITINATNSQFVVDVLWAIGLAQKSVVYTQGPLGKEYAKEQGNFASTGGWNLANGDAVEYLNRFDFIPLTDQQQAQVGEIAKNIYRPCCGNSTWFPDCNHGMAALAIIELLVSAGVPEKDIYRSVLGFNSFWFPDSYLTTATYFARLGKSWENVEAKEVLGPTYSSSKGAGEISKKVGPLPYRPATGGSCGA